MRITGALGMAAWPLEMESPWWNYGQKSIELQSTGNIKEERFSQNGTARLLWCSVDNEARHSRHPAVFGACFMAKSRALRLEWISSDLSLFRGTWWGKCLKECFSMMIWQSLEIKQARKLENSNKLYQRSKHSKLLLDDCVTKVKHS